MSGATVEVLEGIEGTDNKWRNPFLVVERPGVVIDDPYAHVRLIGVRPESMPFDDPGQARYRA